MRSVVRRIVTVLVVAATGAGCAPSEVASQFLHGRDTLADERRAAGRSAAEAESRKVIDASAVVGLGNALIR